MTAPAEPTYRDAKLFKLHLRLMRQNPRTIEFSDGVAAEREAVRLLAEDYTAHPKRIGSPMAHIEFVIPNGTEWGRRGTYARFNDTEYHRPMRYIDPAARGGIRYTCSCGGRRYSLEEVDTHLTIAGVCLYCWGEEDVHPIEGGQLNRDAWVDCPACGGTGEYAANPPEFDRARFTPDHATHTPRPVWADHSW